MILRYSDPEAAQRWCEERRSAGASLGFVPTMGALHAGHMALVERAVSENDAVCVSVFVNPLQFEDAGDLARYPVDFEGDCDKLGQAGCAMAFTGSLATFFPGELEADGSFPARLLKDPGPGAAGLEGEGRPGHFAGVATIVARLFELVCPARAYFGRKDFQQTLVVRHVAGALGYPEIRVVPTVREAGGLALSSRNAQLGAAEREQALALPRALETACGAWREGLRTAPELGRALRAVLEREGLECGGLEIGYAAVRDPERWTAQDPAGELERAVAVVAARVGGVRLLDNALLHVADPMGES